MAQIYILFLNDNDILREAISMLGEGGAVRAKTRNLGIQFLSYP